MIFDWNNSIIYQKIIVILMMVRSSSRNDLERIFGYWEMRYKSIVGW